MLNIPPEHIPSNQELERLEAGDESVVTQLIEGLTSFIHEEVKWFLINNPSFRKRYDEDILAEGLLILTDFVVSCLGKKLTSDKMLCYMKKKFRQKISEWLVQIGLPIHVPAGSLFKYDGREWDQERINSVTGRELRQSDKKIEDEDLFSDVWFEDFLETLDETDRFIVVERTKGKTMREISDELQRHVSYVSRRLKRLKVKYLGE